MSSFANVFIETVNVSNLFQQVPQMCVLLEIGVNHKGMTQEVYCISSIFLTCSKKFAHIHRNNRLPNDKKGNLKKKATHLQF